MSGPSTAARAMARNTFWLRLLTVALAVFSQSAGVARRADFRQLAAAPQHCKLSASSLAGAMNICDSVDDQVPLGPSAVSPQTISDPAVKLLGWQIPVLDRTDSLLPAGASENARARMRDSRSWIWGAMLIGMADWASASGNDTLWDWLQVRHSHRPA